jgi:hypothetical protein
MKFVKYFLFLTLFSVVFIACKKPKEEDPQPSISEQNLTKSEWKGDSIRVKANAQGQNIDQRLPLTGATITFKTDKTFSSSFGQGTTPQTGTWELLENDTKIKLLGGFRNNVTELINQILPVLSTQLPQGTTIDSITIPEIFAIKTLTETKFVFNGDITINVKIASPFGAITLPIPANTDFSFKR